MKKNEKRRLNESCKLQLSFIEEFWDQGGGLANETNQMKYNNNTRLDGTRQKRGPRIANFWNAFIYLSTFSTKKQ